MAVEVIDKIKPKNGGSFPVVEAVDVEVSEGLRLPEALGQKAEQTDLEELSSALEEKADASDITGLQAQIDQLITPVTQDAEVQNARVDVNGVSHATLKKRLDISDTLTNDVLDELNAIVDNPVYGHNIVSHTTGSTRTIIFDGLNLEANTEYFFKFDFENPIGFACRGYIVNSSNTDVADKSLSNYSTYTWKFTPETAISNGKLEIGSADGITVNFKCTWGITNHDNAIESLNKQAEKTDSNLESLRTAESFDATFTEGKYYVYNSGTLGTLAECAASSLIDVSNFKKIYLCNLSRVTSDASGYCFYTDQNIYISGGNYDGISTDYEITVPEGAKYFGYTDKANTHNSAVYADINISFQTAINAINSNVENVATEIYGEGATELIGAISTKTDKTSGGVTYTWNGAKTEISVSGTRTATSFNTLVNMESELANGFVAGKKYTVIYETSNPDLIFDVLYFKDGVNTSHQPFTSDGVMEIPADCTGITLRYQVTVAKNSSITATASMPEVYSIPDELGLIQRVTNLEEEINGSDENPLSLIKETAGLLSCFQTVGCIGDSLASGEVAYKENGETHYSDMYEFSWGQCLARMTGNTYYNFSRGGLTTKTWLESSYATQCFDGEHKCTAYFIGLGQNDKNVSMTVGTTADIDLSDYNNNADTYCGNYGKIIQKIQEMQPKAKIFCFVDPHPPHDDQSYNEAVRDIIELFDNVYLLDLAEYGESLFRGANSIIGSQLRSGHYSALAYQYIAYVIATYVDWIMKNNLSEFSQIEFIGTDRSWS